MSQQIVYGTHLKDIANKERLANVFSVQKEMKKPAFYVLPSHMWLQAARQKQPGLLVTTFDDIAQYLLKQAGYTYISLSEQERSLFFQQFMREEGVIFGDDIHIGKAQGYADTYGQVKRLGLALNDLPASLQSLYSLFANYEKKVVQERNLLDPENIILRAISYLQETTDPINVSIITIDGYYDFSPLQALLIEALKKANISVEVYVPTHTQLNIIDRTVAELVSMGFSDQRQEVSDVTASIEMELVAATTNEEQWRGVMEEITLGTLPLNDVGVVVVDEKNGMKELERYASMYDVPVNKSKKRPLSATSIHAFLLTIIQQTGAIKTKWEQLPLVEHILRLYQVGGLVYAKQKQTFLQTGQWNDPDHEQLFEAVFQLSWKKSDRFVAYLRKLASWAEQLSVGSYWQGRFEVETDVHKLKELADEYKAWTQLVNQLKEYEKLLTEKGLEDLELTLDLFADWFKELGERTHLFEQRATKSGLAVHTWRDVGLFKGKKLYVVGMNEGVFPALHHLSGYLHERDLIDSKVLFSPPTQAHFREKQQAYFEQLPYLSDSITFSYVKGIDPSHPLLASPLLESLEQAKRQWSWDTRMQQEYVLTDRDEKEKITFHIGRGFEVEEVPSDVENVVARLRRLEEGQEPVSLPIDQVKPVVSVTALESYVRCPFRYAMERVLEVSEAGAAKEQVSPLDIGQMVHAIIEEMYKKLDLIGVPFGEGSDKLASVPNLLNELFEEKWELVEEQSHELSRLDLLLTKQDWQKRLQRWWQAERKHFWDNPALSHMSIMALEKAIRFEFLLKNGQMLILVGKADRVDLANDAFVVYDYKTGKASVNSEEVRAGLKLQLPLYAFAIRAELEQQQGRTITADGATYISLKEPSKRAGNGMWRPEQVEKGSKYFVSSFCKNREETLGTEAFLEQYELKERIEQIWNGMQTNFPVQPLDCASHCPFRSVCRVTDEKKEEHAL
ncbi:PD-(D/E)XK nuclease family protein [Halalkalibacter nanhaiisediminis]|uniref:ATP-dependent helicase/DNAse subunit B n=1 Tax=Halalkalibacter nanhaiisediminis TaxID=688079 RepID=A0A562QK84_9BACI|nr:PD-(D/E)XK nuclease family protein [Halalkalibacter nanhaiisediminis]TWI57134.1 ATP-dependent helicase/DNAse subunit B [Halalkalibacter nanhaiisediminis]